MEKQSEVVENKNFKKVQDDVLGRVLNLYYQNLLTDDEYKGLIVLLQLSQNRKDLERVNYELDKIDISKILEVEAIQYDIEKFNNTLEVFKESRGGIDIGNWEKIFDSFFMQSQGINNRIQQNSVKSMAAELLERLYQHSKNDITANQLKTDILTFFNNQTKLPSWCYIRGDELKYNKKLPSFLESIEATFERYDVLEKIPEAFGENLDGMIIGGSMSYGAFYNVRSEEDPSDVDLICIYKDDFDETWNQLEQSQIFTDEDRVIFLQRFKVFQRLKTQGSADILSQKFDMGDFHVSIHFFDNDMFSRLTEVEAGYDLIVSDYRLQTFKDSHCEHYAVNRAHISYEIPESKDVSGGVITELTGYLHSEGQFYPGLYQQLLLPNFFIGYDKSGKTATQVSKYQEYIQKELHKNYDSSSIHNFHMRKEIFGTALSLD